MVALLILPIRLFFMYFASTSGNGISICFFRLIELCVLDRVVRMDFANFSLCDSVLTSLQFSDEFDVWIFLFTWILFRDCNLMLL